MKVTELLEAKEELKSPTVVGSMLLKLYRAKEPMKVLMTGLNQVVRHPDGKRQNVAIPDQEWNITKVTIKKSALDTVEVRVHTDAPDNWFELNPEDDGVLKIKDHRKDLGYWLLTSRDGKGVKL